MRSDAVSLGAVALLPAIVPGVPGSAGRAGPIVLLIVLAVVALLALLVAAAAYRNDPARRRRPAVEDDSDLFTTTPLPMPKEELARMAAEMPPHHAFREHRLPQWVQVGSVIAALAITGVVAERLRDRDTAGRGETDSNAPAVSSSAPWLAGDSTAGATPADAAPAREGDEGPAPFAFRLRDWIATSAGTSCTGRLEVTRGTPSEWNLVARVHDDRGQLLDSARTRVAALREGDVVEFTFARAPCGRIGAWSVRGDRDTPQ